MLLIIFVTSITHYLSNDYVYYIFRLFYIKEPVGFLSTTGIYSK